MHLLAITMAAFAVHMIVGCDRSPSTETAASRGGESGPLAYTVHKADGMTLATFDGWETTASTDDKGTTIRSHPRGRKDDFTLILYIAPMNAQDQATYLDETPTAFARAIPGMQPRGDARATTVNGSDARLIDYELTGAAVSAVMPGAIGSRVARAAFVRKNDVGVMAFAAGTPEAMAELGRAVDIAAENVSFTESPIEPALVGRWYNTGSTSSSAGPNMFSITWERTTTFAADGSFRETDLTIGSSGMSGIDSERVKTGRVVRRGANLTFHYDDGAVRTSDYAVQGDALQLHGKRWDRR